MMEGDNEFVGKRRRSKIEAYYHLVWTTKGRQFCLTPDLERQVHRCISDAAEASECKVLAIDGMPDHVHVVIRAPGKFSPSELAKMFKGRSSALVNRKRPYLSDVFRWQPGFGCFTISRSHLSPVVDYVQNQKKHHEESNVWPEWEEADEESDQ